MGRHDTVSVRSAFGLPFAPNERPVRSGSPAAKEN